MLLYGEVDHDARVRREAAALIAAGHEICIGTLASSPAETVRFLDGARIVPVSTGSRGGTRPGAKSPFASTGRGPFGGRVTRVFSGIRWLVGYVTTYRSWRRHAIRALPPADVWHGHDLLGLLAARGLKGRYGGRLVYDSHELFLETASASRMPGPVRKLIASMEGRAARGADAVITVNDAVAAELQRRYRVKAVVVMNCPPLLPGGRIQGAMRATLGLGERPVVLHHGVLQIGRGIEQLIDATDLLPPEVAVVLLGYGDRYELAAKAAESRLAGRLYVHPAVPIDQIQSWVADATIGVMPFQPLTLNIRLSTPNKMFEFLERGVPMVACDFPAIRQIIEASDAGIICDTTSPAAIARAIETLLAEPPERRAARSATERRAAETTYNWGAQAAVLTGLYAGFDRRRNGANAVTPK
jgi:glycosyltransferase involved in cell wall biosynthesis